MTYAEKTSYKRGATDFSSQVAKMKEAGCDGVVMGTIIRETIGVIGTAKKLDWNPAFVGTTASYFDIIHKLGGAAVNGFYSPAPSTTPMRTTRARRCAPGSRPTSSKYGEDPTVLSAYGYELTDLFIAAAAKAGKDLNPDTLAKSLETLSVPGRTSSAATSRNSRPPSTSAPTARCCARSRTASGSRCRSI